VNASNLLAACLALALPALVIGQDAIAAGTSAHTERGELVRRIVLKWGGHVQEAYQADVGKWASRMVPVFGRASMDALRRAADARTFDQMNNELLAGAGMPGAVPAGLSATLPTAPPRCSATPTRT
jgi:hypothetical protein